MLNSAPRHVNVWGSGGITPCILNLFTRRRCVVSYTPSSLYPRGKNPDTHWIESWVGPRVDLDVVVKRKYPAVSGIELR
jgi:hypothetical protein